MSFSLVHCLYLRRRTAPSEMWKTERRRSNRRRATTLAELVNVAVFMASDRAGAMIGAANLTGW